MSIGHFGSHGDDENAPTITILLHRKRILMSGPAVSRGFTCTIMHALHWGNDWGCKGINNSVISGNVGILRINHPQYCHERFVKPSPNIPNIPNVRIMLLVLAHERLLKHQLLFSWNALIFLMPKHCEPSPSTPAEPTSTSRMQIRRREKPRHLSRAQWDVAEEQAGAPSLANLVYKSNNYGL